jgi:serine O-acetyltransferase
VSRRSDPGHGPRLGAAVAALQGSQGALGLRMDEVELPSRVRVAEILEDLYSLLFPGFFTRSSAQEASVHGRCERVVHQLGAEISRSLRLGGAAVRAPAGEEIALDLLEALPGIQQLLHEDADAALQGDPAARSVVEVILSYPSIRAIATHRLAHFLHQRRVPLIPRMMAEHLHERTGIDIHPGARIGPGLFIDHGTGVVIGETAVIGRWCKLYQGVTLGALSVENVGPPQWDPPRRHPTLEDHVTVYAHATILGGRTVVGAGSVIGGNVWLTRSVPPQTKVQIDPPNLLYRTASGAAPTREQMDYQI